MRQRLRDERATADADVKAFFGLGRPVLYLGALGLLLVFSAGAAGFMASAELLGLWRFPVATGMVAGLAALVRRRPAGRGAMWVFASRVGVAPTITVVIWLALTLALGLFAGWAELSV